MNIKFITISTLYLALFSPVYNLFSDSTGCFFLNKSEITTTSFNTQPLVFFSFKTSDKLVSVSC